MTTRSQARRRRPGFETLEGRALLTAGTLDPTFGAGAGYVTSGLTANDDVPQVVAVQPWDGKVVVGVATVYVQNTDFVLFRYNTDGSPDTTFGTGGRVVTDFYGGDDTITGLAFTPGHQIVAAGQVTNYTAKGYNTLQVGVARYNADGSLDATFGTGGKVAFQGFTTYKENKASAKAVAVDPSGNVVLAGTTVGDSPNSPNSPVYTANLLARLTPGGQLDPTFGSGGKVLGTGGSWSILRLQPAGSGSKIDVVGTDQG